MSKARFQAEGSPAAISVGGRLVFWMLILLGFCTLTPCVLLPEWRQYQALQQAQQVQQHRVDELQRKIAQEQRLLTALSSDPNVVGRLAQREYRYRRVGDQLIPVSPATPDAAEQAEFRPAPVPLPPILARAASYLPRGYDYDRVFGSPETRPLIMAMSVTSIGLAFVLFSRRRDRA